MTTQPTKVGIISDTHNLLRPQVLDVFKGMDQIVHAGDICDAQVLEGLQALAPVTAVRGNNDRGEWASHLPLFINIPVRGQRIFVVHNLADIKRYPEMQADAKQAQITISGHSHRAYVKEEMMGDQRRLLINPGSAGPRRFRLAITIAELLISDHHFEARIIQL